MSMHPVSRTYAIAAYRISTKWQTFLQTLSEATQHPDFIDAFDNPNVPKKVIIDILHKLHKMDQAQTGFVQLLMDKKRLALASQIHKQYQKIALSMSNTELVTINTATKPSASQKQAIEAFVIKKFTNLSIKYQYNVNDALIAGFTVHKGDTFIDCSVHGQLMQLQNSIAGG